MLEKLISLIFRSEIPHDELLTALYSFCSDLLLFSRKFTKTVQDADHYQKRRTLVRRVATQKLRP